LSVRPRNIKQSTLHTARPGIVIGKKGEDIEVMRKGADQAGRSSGAGWRSRKYASPRSTRSSCPRNIAQQLEKRHHVSARAMKRAVQNAMRLGALGVKVDGCRPFETVAKSRVPSGIARAVCPCIPCAPTFDYGTAEAMTTYGQDRREGVDLQGRGVQQG